MPLAVMCSKCKQRYILSEDERKVFLKEIKTQEQLDNVICPACEQKEAQMNKTITVENVDIPLLRRQKQSLYNVVFNARVHALTDDCYDALHGLLHFLDACVDAAEEGETDETKAV